MLACNTQCVVMSPTGSEACRELLGKAMEPKRQVPAHSENLEKQNGKAYQRHVKVGYKDLFVLVAVFTQYEFHLLMDVNE